LLLTLDVLLLTLDLLSLTLDMSLQTLDKSQASAQAQVYHCRTSKKGNCISYKPTIREVGKARLQLRM